MRGAGLDVCLFVFVNNEKDLTLKKQNTNLVKKFTCRKEETLYVCKVNTIFLGGSGCGVWRGRRAYSHSLKHTHD